MYLALQLAHDTLLFAAIIATWYEYFVDLCAKRAQSHVSDTVHFPAVLQFHEDTLPLDIAIAILTHCRLQDAARMKLRRVAFNYLRRNMRKSAR